MSPVRHETASKCKLLEAKIHDHWHTCAKLKARWKDAMVTLPPSFLRDLAVELQELEAVT